MNIHQTTQPTFPIPVWFADRTEPLPKEFWPGQKFGESLSVKGYTFKPISAPHCHMQWSRGVLLGFSPVVWGSMDSIESCVRAVVMRLDDGQIVERDSDHVHVTAAERELLDCAMRPKFHYIEARHDISPVIPGRGQI